MSTYAWQDTVAPAANVICDAVDELPSTLDRLAYITALASAAEAWKVEYVTAARSEGHSWQTIGDALGMSRQAAQQGYGSYIRSAD